MTNHHLIILLFSILFCTGSTIVAFLLKRSNSSKDKLLAQMQSALRCHQGSSVEYGPNAALFDEDLRSAALTTRLQQPRLHVQQNSVGAAAPERYRYIQSMAEMGLSAEEIASTLSMSLHETTQIITLIKMASPKQQDTVKPLPTSCAAVTDCPVATHGRPVEKGILRRPPVAEKSETVRKSQTPMNGTSAFRSPLSCKKNKQVGCKAQKLARWLKTRALPSLLRKQSSREPPRKLLPGKDPLFPTPLSGYT
jgi:hypothetical protein